MYRMYSETIKNFKKQYHLARKVSKEMSKQGINLTCSFVQGEESRVSVGLPPEAEIVRFTTVMKPLVDPSSPISFKRIASLIINNASTPEGDKQFIRNAVKKIETGPIGISMDKNSLNASKVYRLIAKGEFFSEEGMASKSLTTIRNQYPILNPFLTFLFYDYNYEVFKLCRLLFGYIKKIEAETNEKRPVINTKKVEQCIYCLQKDGGFTSEEHVYPESLGNGEVILPPGYVCDRCNNGVLSDLDKYLIEHELFSFLRTMYVPYTKGGKFPIARYKNVMIEKTHPRKVVMKFHNSKDVKVEQYRDTRQLIQVTTCGRTKFNPQRLGRSIYKIALGFLCWKHGPEVAMDDKYDIARKYILGKQAFPNNLLLCEKGKPRPSITTNWYIGNPGTIFGLDIFGVRVAFNLEPYPLLQMNSELERLHFKSFDLSGKKSTISKS